MESRGKERPTARLETAEPRDHGMKKPPPDLYGKEAPLRFQ